MVKMRLFAVSAIILMIVAGVVAHKLGDKHATREALELLRYEARFEMAFLRTRLDLYSSLPHVVSRFPCLQNLIGDTGQASTSNASESLELMASDMDVATIYVQNTDGTVIASSNWRQADSFIGRNYASRPYFRESIAGGHAIYTARGITSGELGLYISAPLWVDGDIKAAVVVKIDLTNLSLELLEHRRDENLRTLVTDESGVVILASDTQLIGSMLTYPPPQARITDPQRYGGTPDYKLQPVLIEKLAHSMERLDLGVHGEAFAMHVPVIDTRWRLHLLQDARAFDADVIWHTWQGVSLGLLASLVILVFMQRKNQQHERMAALLKDQLTGLYSRRYMDESVTKLIAAHQRDERDGFALILFDVDDFKQVNDHLGHATGDRVLKAIADVILSECRPNDTPVRWGGEELALFTAPSDLAQSLGVAERIRKRIEVEVVADSQTITASAGCALHRTGETLGELFRRADALLYQAKQAGRNRVVGDASNNEPAS